MLQSKLFLASRAAVAPVMSSKYIVHREWVDLSRIVDGMCVCMCICRTQSRYDKYFVIQPSAPEGLADSSVEYEAHDSVDLDGVALRGLPSPSTVSKFSFCLAPGEYTVQAIDKGGDSWWGGVYSVIIGGGTLVHEEMSASAIQNTTFMVSHYVAPRTTFSKNQALHGGGGAAFWEDGSPENAERYRNEGTSNKALYEPFVGTPARSLVATASSYDADSGRSMDTDPIVVELHGECVVVNSVWGGRATATYVNHVVHRHCLLLSCVLPVSSLL